MYVIIGIYRETTESGEYNRVYILDIFSEKTLADMAFRNYEEAYNRDNDRFCLDFLGFNPNKVGIRTDREDEKNYLILFKMEKINENGPMLIYKGGYTTYTRKIIF